MEAILSYVLISSICLSVCYLGFLVLQRNEMKLKHLRFYLLMSMLLAIVLPLSKVQIDTPSFLKVYETATSAILNTPDQQEVTVPVLSDTLPKAVVPEPMAVRWDLLLFWLYSIVATLFMLRLLFHLLILLRLYMGSVKQRRNDVSILINPAIQSPFSFFKWVFLTDESINEEILAHEKVHASQYHSLDLILVELLSAVMWFNPFIWMMRKSVHLVHEYLADEGVLRTNIDRLQYQALLVNQVAEEKFICLSSGFHHSLLKKRLIMMTKNKPDPRLRILILVPIALLLFIGVAYMNGQNAGTQSSVVQKSETKKDSSENVMKKNSKYLNSAFGIQQSSDGKVQSFFTREYYKIVINEGKFFVQVGDKQIKSEAEYLAINPKDVQKVVMSSRTEKEKLEKYLKGNLHEFLKGNYRFAMTIILKANKVPTKDKFASWITENAYTNIILKERFFVVSNDKHLTKEQYLSIEPTNIDSIKLTGGVQTEQDKERIRNYLISKGLNEDFTIGKYAAVLFIVLKKKQ